MGALFNLRARDGLAGSSAKSVWTSDIGFDGHCGSQAVTASLSLGLDGIWFRMTIDQVEGGFSS